MGVIKKVKPQSTNNRYGKHLETLKRYTNGKKPKSSRELNITITRRTKQNLQERNVFVIWIMMRIIRIGLNGQQSINIILDWLMVCINKLVIFINELNLFIYFCVIGIFFITRTTTNSSWDNRYNSWTIFAFSFSCFWFWHYMETNLIYIQKMFLNNFIL